MPIEIKVDWAIVQRLIKLYKLKGGVLIIFTFKYIECCLKYVPISICDVYVNLSQDKYTDATVACDGKFYKIHKLVLSTCSEYFEQMFEQTDCKHPIVVLKDIRYLDLEALLSYMYIGEVNVEQNHLPSLIKAAEGLRIRGLAVSDDEAEPRTDSRDKRAAEDPRTVSRNKRSVEEGAEPESKRRREEDRNKRLDERRPSECVRNKFRDNCSSNFDSAELSDCELEEGLEHSSGSRSNVVEAGEVDASSMLHLVSVIAGT